jgi:hypothetical protein
MLYNCSGQWEKTLNFRYVEGFALHIPKIQGFLLMVEQDDVVLLTRCKYYKYKILIPP